MKKTQQQKATLHLMQNARQVARYYDVYRNFLSNNGLADDSKTISVKDLFDFVDNDIDEDERNHLISQSKI